MRSSNYFRLGFAAIAASFVVSSATITSLTLSPTDVVSGGTSTATVILDTNPPTLTGIALSSSNPSIATVPSKIDLGSKLGGRASFAVHSVAGSSGCATISARLLAGASKTAMIFVQPAVSNGPITLTLSSGTAQGATTLTGTIKVNQPSSASVQLSSNNPSVTVPASVALIPNEIGISIATFPIHTTQPASQSCAIITATFNGSDSKALLKLSPLFFG